MAGVGLTTPTTGGRWSVLIAIAKTVMCVMVLERYRRSETMKDAERKAREKQAEEMRKQAEREAIEAAARKAVQDAKKGAK